jgi:alkanesulfonate monooxygenase SsuD/methylene tetrahydromethanopterin reductase-like flavin-dependent oxidoreductase (luciferase family)
VRVAEDAATLSIATGGRFDLGVGIGYRQLEFDQFRRKLSHRPSLVEEGIEILRRSWSGQPVNFSGKRFEVGEVCVTPTPAKKPAILLGGMAPPAIERAARIADGFLCTGGLGLDTYCEALEQQGKAVTDGSVVLGCWAIIAEDPEAEAARIGEHILYQANEYIRWGAFGPPEEASLFESAGAAIENGLYELWDAETAVSELTRLLDTYPNIRDVHFWAQFPGESAASGDRRMRYIAEKVLPRLR